MFESWDWDFGPLKLRQVHFHQQASKAFCFQTFSQQKSSWAVPIVHEYRTDLEIFQAVLSPGFMPITLQISFHSNGKCLQSDLN